ncbi:hypothetical protein SAMN05216548_10459 [Faunimonas pinastri]|uniref:Uncharacterized protein n=1 Tax=Faunimonas pinastri TaxID=1855383 RepID=A0A1H9FAY5_9HYPH|nr:hypothetical protein [Faunimonas pinastri]SEQ35111.1 hypothetical protein SAMN05216548_10459 [Faunimonas pinastri]
MSRLTALFLSCAVSVAAFAAPARANDDAAVFMAKFSGEWMGIGRILIGPQVNSKFYCSLDGDPTHTQLTFNMKGKCWMGKLSAPVFADLHYNNDNQRFYGAFLDGARGNGVDIIGERKGPDGFDLKLTRGSNSGVISASPVGDNQINATLLLHDGINNRDVPVVAMGIYRKGTPAYDPAPVPDVTGSIARAN